MGARIRSDKAMEPSERPRTTRLTARVILRSPQGVLLLRSTDLGVPGLYWWTTPGGGIEDGEDAAVAAQRELAEETGLSVDRDQLIGPIAHRVVAHGYSDQIVVQDEVFFAVDVDESFTPDHSGFTENERREISASGWFTQSQLQSMYVWPGELAELVTADGSSCLELGFVEESTVPVGAPGLEIDNDGSSEK